MAKLRALPAGLTLVGLVCAGLAIYFATQRTGFLASSVRIHHKNAVAFAILAVLALIGAVITYRRKDTGRF